MPAIHKSTGTQRETDKRKMEDGEQITTVGVSFDNDTYLCYHIRATRGKEN